MPTDPGNPLVGWADWSDAATLTTTAGVEGFMDVARLQTDPPTDMTSLDASSVITIIADRGVSAAWNTLLLLFATATAAATLRVRADDVLANLTGTPAYDSTTLPFWMHADMARWVRRHARVRPPADVTSRYIQLDIDDTTNPDGYLRIGRLVGGKFIRTSKAQSTGRTFGYNDASTIKTAVGGQKIVTPVEPAPSQNFATELLQEPEVMALLDLQRQRGASRGVVVMVRPDDATYAHLNLVYGLLKAGPQSKETYFRQYSQQHAVEGLT